MTSDATAPAPPDNATSLRITYRFLRLSILAVVAFLAVSLVFEATKAGCLQSSISAYYYTPVRSVFVGGLLAIGVCLIAMKGFGAEDVFLNLAGMMAPVVAFVPTDGRGDCHWVLTTPPPELELGTTEPITNDTLPAWVIANVNNNVFALLVVGFLAVIAVSVLSRRRATASTPQVVRLNYSLVITEVVLALGAWLYWGWLGNTTTSHFVAAGLMFGWFWVVVLINAFFRPQYPTRYKRIYRTVTYAMPLAFVLIIGTSMIVDWDESVYWLEVAEIALFAAFWLAQSVQRWNNESVAGAGT